MLGFWYQARGSRIALRREYLHRSAQTSMLGELRKCWGKTPETPKPKPEPDPKFY